VIFFRTACRPETFFLLHRFKAEIKSILGDRKKGKRKRVKEHPIIIYRFVRLSRFPRIGISDAGMSVSSVAAAQLTEQQGSLCATNRINHLLLAGRSNAVGA
jgi:hypothetical protein